MSKNQNSLWPAVDSSQKLIKLKGIDAYKWYVAR